MSAVIIMFSQFLVELFTILGIALPKTVRMEERSLLIMPVVGSYTICSSHWMLPKPSALSSSWNMRQNRASALNTLTMEYSMQKSLEVIASVSIKNCPTAVLVLTIKTESLNKPSAPYAAWQEPIWSMCNFIGQSIHNLIFGLLQCTMQYGSIIDYHPPVWEHLQKRSGLELNLLAQSYLEHMYLDVQYTYGSMIARWPENSKVKSHACQEIFVRFSLNHS